MASASLSPSEIEDKHKPLMTVKHPVFLSTEAENAKLLSRLQWSLRKVEAREKESGSSVTLSPSQ